MALAATITTGCQGEIRIDNNLIKELGSKHHIFRQGEYEGAIDSNSEVFRKIDQDQSILWDLVFHKETEFNFEKKDPKLGWQWSLLPVKDLSAYKKEAIEYSRDQKKLVLSPAGIVVGHEGEKINVSLIYLPLILLLAIGLFINTADLELNDPEKICKDKTEKHLNPLLLYLAIILYCVTLFFFYIFEVDPYMYILIFLLYLVAVIFLGLFTEGKTTAIIAAPLLLILTTGSSCYVAPTKDITFLSQYVLFLGVVSFITYFLTQSTTNKITEWKKRKIKKREKAYEK